MICLLGVDEHSYTLEPHYGDEPSAWLSHGGLRYLRGAGWDDERQHRVSAWLIRRLVASGHLWSGHLPPLGDYDEEFDPTNPCRLDVIEGTDDRGRPTFRLRPRGETKGRRWNGVDSAETISTHCRTADRSRCGPRGAEGRRGREGSREGRGDRSWSRRRHRSSSGSEASL